MISKCKAAIFDMDGTLLDSMRFWRFAALEYMMSKHIPISEDALAGVFRRSARETVSIAYHDAGLTDADISPDLGKDILKLMSTRYDNDVYPKEGALEYIKKLHEQGIRCCVATATQKDHAMKVLKYFGFDKYIEFVFDTDDAGCSKANEQYFFSVAEKLGVPVTECVMYEDALYSIRTAKKVGMYVVAIEDDCAIAGREEIKQLADIYIERFSDLM